MGKVGGHLVEAALLAVAAAAICLYPRDGLFARLGVHLGHRGDVILFVGLGIGGFIAAWRK